MPLVVSAYMFSEPDSPLVLGRVALGCFCPWWWMGYWLGLGDLRSDSFGGLFYCVWSKKNWWVISIVYVSCLGWCFFFLFGIFRASSCMGISVPT